MKALVVDDSFSYQPTKLEMAAPRWRAAQEKR